MPGRTATVEEETQRSENLSLQGSVSPHHFTFATLRFGYEWGAMVQLRAMGGSPEFSHGAGNTFGVYVFHAMVLVLVSLALRALALHAVPKFAIVSLLALTCSLLVTWAIRQVPFLRRLFS